MTPQPPHDRAEPHNDNTAGHRAEPVRLPPPTRPLEEAELRRRTYLRGREKTEHRSLVRGLFILALLVLLYGMARAGLGHEGLGRAFPPNWWRP